MFIDRQKPRTTHLLEWKLRLFGTGGVLAVGGVVMEISWVVNVAIAVLIVAMLLRFVPAPEPLEAAEVSESPESDEDA